MEFEPKIRQILIDNQFFDELNKELYIGSSQEDLKKEINNNIVTLAIKDDQKDVVNADDLKKYFQLVLNYKRRLLGKKIVNKIILFRVWHDETSNWLRYNFLSKFDDEVKRYHARTYDLKFVDKIDYVLQSFLDQRSKGYYITDKYGTKTFYRYSPPPSFSDPPPWKIYEEEIVPTRLQVIK